MAHAHGLPVSMMNAQANYMAQIAAALPNHCAMEVVDPGREHCLVWHDQIEDGYIVLGDAPGFGITVDEAKLRSCRPTHPGRGNFRFRAAKAPPLHRTAGARGVPWR